MTAPDRGRTLRALSRIWVRLLTFNVLLVFLPAGGVLVLDTYEQHMREAQERTMGQEGRLLAAALEANGALVDEQARRILIQLGQRHQARLRVIDRNGRLLADSSRLGPRRDDADDGARDPAGIADSPLYRIGSLPFRLLRGLAPGPEPASGADFYDQSQTVLGPEVRDALAGRYGASTRVIGDERPTVLLYITIPVRIDGAVEGAVLVSQSTRRILGALYAVRLNVFRVFLASLAVSVLLSIVMATTIARPLSRLRARAEAILDRTGRLRGSFTPSRRRDEIGDLERALAELTRRLEEHLQFTEAFAADVSHEFKNPLASIRTATELAIDAEDGADRRRFLEMIQRDVARMERLLSEVREISRLDAQLDEEARESVELDRILASVVDGARLRTGGRPQLVLALADHAVTVAAAPDRLVQVLDNLLANAISFTPTGGAVTVTLRVDDGVAEITVADDGPGVPAEHRERIFERFFSYRPEITTVAADAGTGHTGLGLAIVKSIVDSHGGSVRVDDRGGGGAKFSVRLPLVRSR